MALAAQRHSRSMRGASHRWRHHLPPRWSIVYFASCRGGIRAGEQVSEVEDIIGNARHLFSYYYLLSKVCILLAGIHNISRYDLNAICSRMYGGFVNKHNLNCSILFFSQVCSIHWFAYGTGGWALGKWQNKTCLNMTMQLCTVCGFNSFSAFHKYLSTWHVALFK